MARTAEGLPSQPTLVYHAMIQSRGRRLTAGALSECCSRKQSIRAQSDQHPPTFPTMTSMNSKHFRSTGLKNMAQGEMKSPQEG